MTFSRKVHHDVGLVAAKNAIEFSSITNIHLFKSKSGILGNRRQ